MSKEKTTSKTTTTTTKVKRPVGRPKKSAATTATPPVPKSLKKLATAKRAAKPIAKKPSEKAQATRELNKAVKGTHARPSTTPELYDARAAFELTQTQINVLKRKNIDLEKRLGKLLKVVDVQGKAIDKLVLTHNAEVRKPVEAVKAQRKIRFGLWRAR